MIKGINLLEKSVIETKDLRALKRKVIVSSLTILISFFIVNLAVFLYGYTQAKKLGELNNLIEARKTEVLKFKEREVKYQVIKEKLTFLVSIPNEKVNFDVLNKLINYLSEIEKTGVTIKSLDISEKGAIFTVNAKDSVTLSLAINSLIDNEAAKKIFKTVELNRLVQNKNGDYTLGINLTLN